MKKLIKTINGAECEIFAIKNHQRIYVGKAASIVEVYQNAAQVKVLGNTETQYKTYEFALIICSGLEFENGIPPDFSGEISHFDITMLLQRKDKVFVPFGFYGLTDFSVQEPQKWVFNVDNRELTRKLLDM
jgi:hypothetical protein